MPHADHSLRHDSKIQRPITFFRNRTVPNAPPSLVKLSQAVSELIKALSRSIPTRDQVPEEMYAKSSPNGAAATALAVSCVAGATTRASPKPRSSASHDFSGP